jgi:hypothetical protein
MTQTPNIDGILITWGDRLFYQGNRVVKVKPQPQLSGDAGHWPAAAICKRIVATVVRRAPQVMVKVTGGGRGIKPIALHFRYISKNGRLEIEDQRGEMMRGNDSLRDLADEWRFGGSLIPDDGEHGHRREAYNIMLSMPQGELVFAFPLALLFVGSALGFLVPTSRGIASFTHRSGRATRH